MENIGQLSQDSFIKFMKNHHKKYSIDVPKQPPVQLSQ